MGIHLYVILFNLTLCQIIKKKKGNKKNLAPSSVASKHDFASKQQKEINVDSAGGGTLKISCSSSVWGTESQLPISIEATLRKSAGKGFD